MTFLASWTMDMWSPIINLFSFIPSYGFMIIVFTIALKLILSPLDIWQKKVSRDSMRKQAKMQPELEKLKRTCGNNTQLLNQKTMQLYKKEGYNVVGSCFSMLLNMALTLFIFITLFSALTEISQDKIFNQYKELNTTYRQVITTELGVETYDEAKALLNSEIDLKKDEARALLIEVGIAEPADLQVKQKAFELIAESGIYSANIQTAQNAVAEKYEEIKDSWLWIDNIWRPDTYVAGFPNYNDFYNIANVRAHVSNNEQIEEIALNFNVITQKIQTTYNSWNGYFILVVLAALVTYLSIWISQKNTTMKKKQIKPVNNSVKQANQVQVDPGKSMVIMKIIMPIVMVIFTFSYSAAFALYIVTNSIMATIINFACLKLFEKIEKNKEEKDKINKKIEYSR